MAKALITKEVVFTSAKKLIERGIYPTQNNIRAILGHGSMRDIGFYLREWKQQCFAANKTTPLLQEELANVTLELDDLEKEHKQAAKIQHQLQQQINALTIKLQTTEQRANKLELQAETLQAEAAMQADQNAKLVTEYHQCQEILKEREKNLEVFINDKNQLITSLRQELKETAEQAIQEAREYNHRQHDTFLKLQIENINFQNEVQILNKRIKDKEEQILSLKLSVVPLKQKLQEKEAIIKTYVTKEELDLYINEH